MAEQERQRQQHWLPCGRPGIDITAECVQVCPNGYNAWCFSRGFVNDGCQHVNEYVMQVHLDEWPADLPDYPGGCHLVQLFLGIPSSDESYNKDYWPMLSKRHFCLLQLALDKRYITLCRSDKFEIGKILSDRWEIIDVISSAEGAFNQGIYRVAELDDYRQGVLKLLPAEAIHPGYTTREIFVHSALDHLNIVQLYDSCLPTHRHDTPYIITEYCDGATLKDMVKLDPDIAGRIPELLIFQIFEDLLRAVHYCHHGPTGAEDWDPVSHRDINTGNVFLMKTDEDTGPRPEFYPLEALLGDFGCAVTESELNTTNADMDNLPAVDYLYVPPEGPVASEAADLYQVGLVMFCLLCDVPDPYPFLVEPFVQSEQLPDECEYSNELQTCILECLNEYPEDRPSASHLVYSIVALRKKFMEDGTLFKVEFDIP